MPSKTKTLDVEIEKLLLDENNPRFAKPLSQDDLLARFAGQSKTLKLASHIAANGTNPLDMPAVVKSSKAGRYVVKEGNRRVAVLKLLTNPHLAPEDRLVSRYRILAKDAAKGAIPKKIACVLFPNAADAYEWMLVKHGGQLEGAGTVDWDSLQKGRFNLRSGRSEQYSQAISFLDEAVGNEWVTEEAVDEVNLSSLARVLNDRQVQKLLRLDSKGEQFAIGLADDGPKDLAKRLVKDWRKEGGLKVEEIYNQDKRLAYAQRLKDELELREGSGRKASETKSDTPAHSSSATSGKTGRGAAQHTRGPLVPRSFQVSFPDGFGRMDKVLKEMKSLDADKFTNHAAVMFRTFFEVSVHHYLDTHKLPKNQSDTLNALTERVMTHLKSNHSDAEAAKEAVKPVKRGFSSPGGLFQVTTLHDYVHHAKLHPIGTELRNQWDNYSAFLKLIWA